MGTHKISAVINTYNAEQHLSRVIESLKCFDEILICDMQSTDSTVDIAHEEGCRVVTFPKENHTICEPARDFAIHSAANPWVIVVDADEIVPQALADYLYQRISEPDCPDALALARRNLFLGRPASGGPDYQLRFFRKDKAFWPPIIHARPKIDGTMQYIPRNRKELYLQHLDDAPLHSRFDKLNRYSDYETPKRAHRKFGIFKTLMRPAWFFFKSYILGGGFKMGKRGIFNAYMAATYQIMLLSKIYEQKLGIKD